MFYTEEQGHAPLPFDPFKAIIAPRPIGWISTVDTQGRPNLGPYSFFNAVAAKPNMIGFSSTATRTPRATPATPASSSSTWPAWNCSTR